MARFMAEIQGNRGSTSRSGSKASGIDGHIRGWNLGIKVQASVDDDGNDVFTVYRTGGSNRPGVVAVLAQIRED